MRYTSKDKDNYVIDHDQLAVINKLGRLEDLVEQLNAEQIKLSNELEGLRKDNQVKSYRFRELLGKKLTNSALLNILDNHHLT